ncbi:Lpg1974 family pore-forming outer membrane protein [Persicirhabdus sediminis]|uniref:Outer membrane protein beta-barrel domain-containing protein n=1 Tax=Persicirhabdus sediminis TaxID=454144 RepID=A0A8J7SNZ4_9BACT|nr:Lpg1974 family pore-forming outer membrane protein [Persicirhabdus sediminis]MBK1792003.1 hypothetical protein [Persicirhabdus sediminis]
MKTQNTIKSIGCAIAASAALVATTQAGEVMPMAAAPVADCPWGLGLEALYMKAHGVDGRYAEQDYEFAWRADLSYKQADNLGIRFTYFWFEGSDDTADFTDDFYTGSEYSDVDVQYGDLEFFDTFELGAWQGEYSAGIRWGELNSEYGYTETDGFGIYEEARQSEFSGWGPTFGLELVRPIGSNFSVYAGVRASWLFGDNDVDEATVGGESIRNEYEDSYSSSESLFIAEGTLGLQYDYLAFRGCPSYVRLGAEAQNWSASGEDVSLFGGSLRFGFGF